MFGGGRADTGRVEAFSDGVLAIVITLLVLEIHVPSIEGASDAVLWAALRALWPKIAAWAVSFVFVLVFWVSHHYYFQRIKQIDRGLLWLNGIFLLAICFTPFPTALVGEYPGSHVAAAMLAGAFFLTASSFVFMRWYGYHYAGLVDEQLSAAQRMRQLRRGLLAPGLYLAATLIALVNVTACLILVAGVPLLFVVPPKEN